jgi:protocatechuate 4,5-dioxygenase beta chain/2,3-dihydroxyphenylpropionate 1,2-dioxygenase
MGEIVIGAAISHAPGITGWPDRADSQQSGRFYAGIEKLSRTFADAKPDVILLVCNEHFVNFYLSNMPAICVGTGQSHFGPVEPEAWLHIPKRRIAGHPALARALVMEALNSGFDLSFSEELALDHGAMVPLHLVAPETNIPVVPIIVNNIAEPMPSPGRVYQLGALLRRVVSGRPKGESVAIIGTGGLSHWVGTPEQGCINIAFDERFLESAAQGKGHELAGWIPEEIGKGGNGAHEVRNWLGVMGAFPKIKGEVVAYEPVVKWATGCGAIIWNP